jgi:transketolase
VTAEDHHIDTGLGSLVAAIMAENSLPCRLVRLGVTKYGFSGKPEELYRSESINRQGIVKAVVQARTTVHSKK